MFRIPWIAAVAASAALTFCARGEDRFFDSDGVRIRYVDQGQGEPVVLIHGFTGNADLGWTLNRVLPALSLEYRVIALDCRGHGRSDKPHDPQAYGAKMAEDVVRLLDHLKIEKAHIVGYSMGGLITLKVMLTHPRRVISAIPAGYGWPVDGKPAGKDFLEALAASLDAGQGVGPLLEALRPADQPPMTAEQVAAVNAMILSSNDAKALAAVIRGFKGLDVDEKLVRANKTPALAIIGGNDPLKMDVDRLAAAMPGLKVVTIPNADHGQAMFHPDFLSAIREFLAAHRTKPAAENPAAGAPGA